MNNHTVVSQCLPVKTKISALRNTHKKRTRKFKKPFFIYVLHNNNPTTNAIPKSISSPLGNFGSPIDCTSRTAELSHLIWFEIVRGLPQVVSEVVKTQKGFFWQKWCCFFQASQICAFPLPPAAILWLRDMSRSSCLIILCALLQCHTIYFIAILFRYALWLSIINHYLNLYHFRWAGHFWTIELLHHLLWSKAIQFHLSWNMWMEKDASKSTPKLDHRSKTLYLKHLQFCAFIHRLLSLLGAKHFERRKCGHPDVFWMEASLVTYPQKKQTRKPSVRCFPKCGKKNCEGLILIFRLPHKAFRRCSPEHSRHK